MKLNYEFNICDDANDNEENSNTFTVFESINKLFYLIYITKNNSIISYDLINKQIIAEINISHTGVIAHIKHYLDDINKRDLIMTCSTNELKILDIKNYQIIFELNKNFESACLTKYNNKYYIALASKDNPILIYDMEGNLTNEIKNNYYINTICSFNDEENSYLITLNKLSMCSYKNFTFYKIYKEEYRKYGCPCCNGYASLEQMIEYSNGTPLEGLIYKNDKNNIKLIELNEDFDHSDFCIKIWDFHSPKADLVNKIELGEYSFQSMCFSMCLINNNKLFVQSKLKTEIFFLDIIDEEGEFKEEILEEIEELKETNDNNYSIRKIDLPSFGECIICKIENKINLLSLK